MISMSSYLDSSSANTFRTTAESSTISTRITATPSSFILFPPLRVTVQVKQQIRPPPLQADMRLRGRRLGGRDLRGVDQLWRTQIENLLRPGDPGQHIAANNIGNL